jgi:hypothetical protein
MRRGIVAIAFLLAASCAHRVPAGPGPSNDAPWTGAWTNVVPPNHTGQTFTAISPVVDHVDIDVITGNPDHGASDTLTLTLLDAGGTPLGSVSRSFPAGTDGWQRFRFAPAVHVRRGDLLTIRVADTGKVLFGWRYTADTYAGGTSVMLSAPDPRFDFRFRVNAP